MFNLILKNFRSFKDQKFHFSKVNILIGENSSGKSSLLKFLLALKQTVQAPASRDINLLFKGEFADLGSYKESVYYQDDTLPIQFTFEFDIRYFDFYLNLITARGKASLSGIHTKQVDKIKKAFPVNLNSLTSATYSVTKQLSKHENITSVFFNDKVGRVEIIHTDRVKEPKQELIFGKSCTINYTDFISGANFQFDEVEYTKEGFTSLITGGSLFSKIKDELLKRMNENNAEVETADIIWDRVAFLLITQNYLKYFLDKIQYINPINTHPSRVYLYRDPKRTTSIDDIEDVVEFFSNDNDATQKIQLEFVKILKKLGLAEDIEIIKEERLPVRELRVKVKDLLSNITDVGYGVSLQLPIILKALLSERIKSRNNSIILIEQPEIHLHPKLHAEIISVLLSLSKNTVYFIETHSEHIIRKLQLLVKDGKYNLNPDDITIHYLKRVKAKSKVSTHVITENGILNPGIPAGFFDNSFNLSRGLLD